MTASRDTAELRPCQSHATPTVDVPALTALLDGKYADIREMTRKNLAEHARRPRRGDRDADRASSASGCSSWSRMMAKTGATGLGFPTEYGGGGDIGASVAGFETLAFGDLSILVKVGVQFGLFGGAILQLGSKHHHDAYIADLVTGDLMGCFAMTETGHGSNVQALGTFATYDAETREFVITTPDDRVAQGLHRQRRRARAAWRWCSPSSRSTAAPRACTRSSYPSGTRTGNPLDGVRIEDDGAKIGLNGVDNGRLWFDGVRVPRENLLNRYADVTEDGALPLRHRERRPPLLHDARHPDPGPRLRRRRRHQRQQGGAGRGDQVRQQAPAVRPARQRRGGAAPRLRHAPAPAAAAAREDLRAALRPGDPASTSCTTCSPRPTAPDRQRRALESRAAGTKALGTWHASRTIQECREACGGAGYLMANRLGALRADTDVFTTFEGDNHILLQLVAKGLLTDYSSSFGDLDQLGMVRFVANLAVETVVERTSAHKLLERIKDVLPGGSDDGWDQEAGLLDPEYQLAMFRWREEHILSGVARRLKRGMDNGMDTVEVFSRVQDHVIAAGRAHVERLVLEAFVREDTRPWSTATTRSP